MTEKILTEYYFAQNIFEAFNAQEGFPLNEELINKIIKEIKDAMKYAELSAWDAL